MRDNRLRRVVKTIVRWRFETDLAITRWIWLHRDGPPEYTLQGSCNGCGACCRTPMIQVHTIVFFARSTRWLLLTWHKWVNGFEYIGENRRERTFIFRCTHFDESTHRCDSYDSRPGMCRDYPNNLTYDPNPEFLPECSHYALSRSAEALREALEELELDAQKKQELAAKLRAVPRPEP